MTKAFTLLELLVVVAIIGILAAVGINQFINYLVSVKQKTLEANYKNIGNSLNVEFSKCILNNSEIVFGSYKCNNIDPPEVNLIEDFFNKTNNIKNPFNTSVGIAGKDPCVTGTIVIAKSQTGSYSVSYVNNSNQTVTSNINTKWSVINTGVANTWTPINTGASNCWTPINTGASNIWTTVSTGVSNIWTAIKP
jgi:prepilin-type N-terminal cleavage/methylation domain-containing protein